LESVEIRNWTRSKKRNYLFGWWFECL